MQKAKKELIALREALLEEKEAEKRYYEQVIKKMDLKERREKGLTWYPLQLIESGFALGDYPFVILQKPETENPKSKLQAGQVVNLFSENAPTDEQNRKGVIHYIRKGQIKIILYSLPMPYWIYDGKLGVDLLFDEKSYQEMDKALKRVIEARSNKLAELRDILYGSRDAFRHDEPVYYQNDQLNPSQNQAIRNILHSLDVNIVHGPPGTGKTTTLVAAAKALSEKERHLLLCAPSNAATDLLTERVAAAGLRVVRLGNISRVHEELIELTLDGQVSKHPDNKELKKLKKKAAEVRRQAHKFKRNFGSREREQRRRLKQEARELEDWVRTMEDRLIDQVMHGSQVVTCTLVGSSSHYLDRLKFDTLIIDEAAQALEPACWIAIPRAGKLILAGDPHQLPPTIKSKEAQQGGLANTLIEKAIDLLPDVDLLDTQYRMHQTIMGFSNQLFYENRLKAHDSVANRQLLLESGPQAPLEFIDTAGCGFSEQQNPETRSFKNSDELTLLREHLDLLLADVPEGEVPSIGIISPYKEQVRFMRREFEQDQGFQFHYALTINTIDSFQGQERDVIYISLVRSNANNVIGFLADTRRMNVAMTRAKKKLIIIGDSATIGNHPFYAKFLNYCEAQDAYHSAWEYMSQ